jgi:hypothetical protein
MNDLIILFAGALLCNSIPHLAAGLRGEPFPTPFATPRGVGHSSPSVNFYWGAGNLFVGFFLLWRRLETAEFNGGLVALVVGFVASGAYLSRHFGRVREGYDR